MFEYSSAKFKKGSLIVKAHEILGHILLEAPWDRDFRGAINDGNPVQSLAQYLHRVGNRQIFFQEILPPPV